MTVIYMVPSALVAEFANTLKNAALETCSVVAIHRLVPALTVVQLLFRASPSAEIRTRRGRDTLRPALGPGNSSMPGPQPGIGRWTEGHE